MASQPAIVLQPDLRPDLDLIASNIPAASRVLDIGCGDGILMARLRDQKGVDVRGLEIDAANVAAAMERGLTVVQGDADSDLIDYPDDSFDIAILSQTLQTTRRPQQIIAELLRIAPRAFVSFPNFAYWRVRMAFLIGGRMPVTESLPVSWYETPNIHHLTIADFRAFLAEFEIMTDGDWFLSAGYPVGRFAANWRAEQAIFSLCREGA